MKLLTKNSRSRRVRTRNSLRSVRRGRRIAVFEALEARRVLASISIDSPTDLQSYYSSSDNSYTIDAGKDDVTISDGITIGSTSGTSSISISGGSITIGEDVQLLASGDITLEAENVMT